MDRRPCAWTISLTGSQRTWSECAQGRPDRANEGKLLQSDEHLGDNLPQRALLRVHEVEERVSRQLEAIRKLERIGQATVACDARKLLKAWVRRLTCAEDSGARAGCASNCRRPSETLAPVVDPALRRNGMPPARAALAAEGGQGRGAIGARPRSLELPARSGSEGSARQNLRCHAPDNSHRRCIRLPAGGQMQP